MSGANVKIEHEPTPKQRGIIESIDENLLILAAVGSGKTSVLAWRIVYAIKNGIDAKKILALTFTNLAARQIRKRVNEIVGPPASHASIRTFHSLCAWVLRTHCAHFGLDPDFSIYDEADSSELIEKLGVNTGQHKNIHGTTPIYALQMAVSEVRTGQATWEGYRTASFIDEDWARRYIESMMEVGAVDFSGLVYLTRALFNEDEEVRATWQQRFDLINVDEVQDTHVSEYEVVRTLSRNSKSTCFFGDPFQTIYEWRGSRPEKLFNTIREEYAPVKEIALSENHRATRQLIKLSRDVAKSLGYTYVLPEPAAGASEGSKPEVRRRDANLEAEIEAVTMRCRRLIQTEGIEPNKIAVLARSNKTVEKIAASYRENEIGHCTTEQSQFFRRPSIKDILAMMRLSMSPTNEAEARRLISRMKNVSEPLNGIRREIVKHHLRFYDFLDATNIQTGDPLSGLDTDEWVVLDTETTGTDADCDEVIEIAASRLRTNVVVETFHRFICPNGNVGESEQVHSHSDEFLRTNGEDAATVFRELADFVGYTPVTGHNIRSFDARIIESHASRVGVPISLKMGIDTLEASRKMLKLSDYRLGTVAQHFGIDTGREHSADDDANTTCGVAIEFQKLAYASREKRRQIYAAYAPLFQPVRELIDRCRQYSEKTDRLLDAAISELSNAEWYNKREDFDKEANELRDRVRDMESDSSQFTTPTGLLNEIALYAHHELDRIKGVSILTIHQAKGMEFDHVFLPALTTRVFPSYYSEKDPKKALEEKRLFFRSGHTSEGPSISIFAWCLEFFHRYIR